MRGLRARLATVVKGVAICLIGVTANGQPPEEDSPEYRAAYEAGRREAEVELREGTPRLFTYGLRGPYDNLDRNTGLIFQAIAGCVVNDEILGRASGHNNRIYEEASAKRTLPGSFKPYLSSLTNLSAFVKRAQASTDRLVRSALVKVGDEPIRSPEGDVTLALKRAQDPEAFPDSPLVNVEITERATGKPRSSVPLLIRGRPVAEARIVWGPAGSGFVVLACPAEDEPSSKAFYAAIDLRRGLLIRAEPVMLDVDADPARP